MKVKSKLFVDLEKHTLPNISFSYALIITKFLTLSSVARFF